ncbi:TVP38/TMEM64 family protein [Bacillus alkalicellulosilyticus]|uniref:TVP38/TMEM64 family protein n=1 Tax=Alkalihalobacterium alkalicellulosilyticum TaxID=1912214 RepID=UPI0009985664|nr:TVP38/TMEM64 family protein [Bacillus alkalicellulosilyticus]
MIRKTTIYKVIFVSFLIIFLLWINHRYLQVSPVEIRRWILSFGWFAPIFYVLLFTLRPFVLFPASVLAFTGGFAFGAGFGFSLTLLGATSGAILSFVVVRYSNYRFGNLDWKRRTKELQQKVEGRGFYYVFLLRVIPVINFDLVSYVTALAKVRLSAYFLGTLLGIIPGTIMYSLLGASLVEGNESYIIIVGLIVLLLVVLLALQGRILRRAK